MEPAPQPRSADLTAQRRSDTETEGPKVREKLREGHSKPAREDSLDRSLAPEDRGLSFCL